MSEVKRKLVLSDHVRWKYMGRTLIGDKYQISTQRRFDVDTTLFGRQ